MTAKLASPTEDRDQQILRRLSSLEQKVGSIDHTTAFGFRANADQSMQLVKKVFRGKRRAQVYLAANSQRDVNEIARLLGMKRPNVSRDLLALKAEDFLEVIQKDGGKAYWGKMAIDRTLKISRFLMKQFELDKNGIPLKQKL